MSFNWTYPQPLSDYITKPSLIGGKTRYVVPTLAVYIQELCDAVNTLRTGIGKAPIDWDIYKPEVGDILLYEHYHHLQLNIDLLIIDYGYNSVIDILGRTWSNYQEDINGKYYAKWQIIQDFRDVLDFLFPSLEQWIRTEQYVPFYFYPSGSYLQSPIEGDLGRWYANYQSQTSINVNNFNYISIHPSYWVYQNPFEETTYQIIPSGMYSSQKNQIGITEGSFSYIPNDADSNIHIKGTGNVGCAYSTFSVLFPSPGTFLCFATRTDIPNFILSLIEENFIHSDLLTKFFIYENTKFKLNTELSANRGRIIYVENGQYVAGKYQDLTFRIDISLYEQNTNRTIGILIKFKTDNSGNELNLVSSSYSSGHDSFTYETGFSNIDSILDFIPDLKNSPYYTSNQLILNGIYCSIEKTSNLLYTRSAGDSAFELSPNDVILHRNLSGVSSWRFEGDIPSYDIKINKIGFINI